MHTYVLTRSDGCVPIAFTGWKLVYFGWSRLLLRNSVGTITHSMRYVRMQLTLVSYNRSGTAFVYFQVNSTVASIINGFGDFPKEQISSVCLFMRCVRLGNLLHFAHRETADFSILKQSSSPTLCPRHVPPTCSGSRSMH